MCNSHGFVETINEGQYLVPRMGLPELTDAIVEPAGFRWRRRKGGDGKPVIGEIGDNMDQLPVLQHALRKTYDFAKKNRVGEAPLMLSYEDYSAIVGKMTSSLDNHAREVYQGFSR